jgi:Fur family ferric uptake transcriptional regulator
VTPTTSRIHHYQAAILETVSTMGSASAQAIHHELRRGGNRVGLSTVYRTLQLLLATGAVWALAFADQTFYEAVSSTIVDAFTCLSCGHTVRTPREDPREVPGPAGFLAAAVPVVVRGTCRSCSPVLVAGSQSETVTPRAVDDLALPPR